MSSQDRRRKREREAKETKGNIRNEFRLRMIVHRIWCGDCLVIISLAIFELGMIEQIKQLRRILFCFRLIWSLATNFWNKNIVSRNSFIQVRFFRLFHSKSNIYLARKRVTSTNWYTQIEMKKKSKFQSDDFVTFKSLQPITETHHWNVLNI